MLGEAGADQKNMVTVFDWRLQVINMYGSKKIHVWEPGILFFCNKSDGDNLIKRLHLFNLRTVALAPLLHYLIQNHACCN